MKTLIPCDLLPVVLVQVWAEKSGNENLEVSKNGGAVELVAFPLRESVRERQHFDWDFEQISQEDIHSCHSWETWSIKNICLKVLSEISNS